MGGTLDIDRLRSFLNSAGATDPAVVPFLWRVADEAPDAVLRGQAQIFIACKARRDEEVEDAEYLFREGLAAVWGSGTLAERTGCADFALMCLLQCRVFEALVLSRRACTLLEQADDRHALAVARGHLAGTLIHIGDWPRVDPALAAVEDALDGLSPDERWHVDRLNASYRTLAAALRGDAQGALKALEVLETYEPPNDPRALPYYQATVFVEAGLERDALELIRSAQAHEIPRDWHSYYGDLIELRCMSAVGEDPIPAAEALLARLPEEARDCLNPGQRFDVAIQLGGLVPAALARRVFDVAGGAALERTSDLDRFVRDLPQLHKATDEDQAILDTYRERFIAEHEELLRSVKELFQASEFSELGDDPMICVCAWCQRVRGPDRLWLPLEHSFSFDGPVSVTHGICHECKAGLRA